MEQLKIKLIQVVNESGLPLDAIYYVCKDFFRTVEDTYQQSLMEQMKQQEEKQNNIVEKAEGEVID